MSVEGWLAKSSQTMKVRRLALRTVETYLGWQRRFLNWVAEKSLEAASKPAVEGFMTYLPWSGRWARARRTRPSARCSF